MTDTGKAGLGVAASLQRTDGMPAVPAATSTLAAGTAGWPLLAALGVAYVVAGDFSSWNFGFAAAGWGGMLIATILMAGMYLCLVFCLAELSSAMPATGGGYAFVRRAFGPTAGFLTGACIAVEYVGAGAAIGIFTASNFEALIGIPGPWLLGGAYIVFLGVHLYGVGEALRLTLWLTGIAVVGLLVFLGTSVSAVTLAHLAGGGGNVASGFLPFGVTGILWALPFSAPFFLAIEGVPLASEEARDPVHTVPRAMLVAWVILALFAFAILIVAPGVVGIGPLTHSDIPLIEATRGAQGSELAVKTINLAGLIALSASLFSTIYAYSRQIYALARAGFLPQFLTLTNRRKAPWKALIVPALLTFLLSNLVSAEALIVVAVFCAIMSYLLMLAAFIRLRLAQPGMARPYRTPGGIVTAGIALMLALPVFVACFLANIRWSLAALALIGAMLAYARLQGRHRLADDELERAFIGAAALGKE